jgi:hypothetical protein
MNIASDATALDWRSIGQFPGQLIDQFPMAAVVVNCPPFRGAMTACHPHQLIHRARQPPCRCRNMPRPAPAGATSTFFVPVKRSHGLTLTTYSEDVRARSLTSGATDTPFHILIADIPPKTICADVSRLAND